LEFTPADVSVTMSFEQDSTLSAVNSPPPSTSGVSVQQPSAHVPARPATPAVQSPHPVHEKIAQRLRARLARPKLTLADARDGMLDCFVSTYYEGLKQGLRLVLGVKADPDEIAKVATQIFRSRLLRHGSSFEAPTSEALRKVKEEADRELHFEELSAEARALHDQVCTLLIAKADGLLEHKGDVSVVSPPKPQLATAPSAVSMAPAPAPAPSAATAMAAPMPPMSSPTPIPSPAPAAVPAAPTPLTRRATVQPMLRDALRMAAVDLQESATRASIAALEAEMKKITAIVQALKAYDP
jgi:hypothetical protein